VFVVFETKSSFFALINQFLLFFLFLSIIKQNKKIIGRRKHSSLSKKKDLGISQSERGGGEINPQSRGEKRAKKKKVPPSSQIRRSSSTEYDRERAHFLTRNYCVTLIRS